MRKKLSITLLVLLPCFVYSQYTFVFLHKKSDKEGITEAQVKKIMEGHMANMERLSKEDKLLVAGPFEGGGGLFILNTQKIEEAKTWLSTDPGVQANRWNIEILSYTPRQGGVCPVGEKYEMTSYSFIRFRPKEDIAPASTVISKHDQYLKQSFTRNNVVTEAIFAGNGDGILILKELTDISVLQSNPAIKEGQLEFEIKKLFIAKGSFCEK